MADKTRFQPFEFTAIHRNKDEAKEVGHGRVMARDAEHAKLLAAVQLPKELHEKLDEVEINVRNF